MCLVTWIVFKTPVTFIEVLINHYESSSQVALYQMYKISQWDNTLGQMEVGDKLVINEWDNTLGQMAVGDKMLSYQWI